MKSLAISDKYGWEKFITLQALYSLLFRNAEYELVLLCLDQGLDILPWSPLSRGFLSKKYCRGQLRPEGSKLSNLDSKPTGFGEHMGYEIVEELDRIAKAPDATIAQAELNYLFHKLGVLSTIIGARKPANQHPFTHTIF